MPPHRHPYLKEKQTKLKTKVLLGVLTYAVAKGYIRVNAQPEPTDDILSKIARHNAKFPKSSR